jgi:hypothetical protein
MFNRIANLCAIMFTGLTVGIGAVVVPAFASPRVQSPARGVESASRGYGAGGIAEGSQGATVYSHGRYVGRDPDPSIRALLLRDDFRGRTM